MTPVMVSIGTTHPWNIAGVGLDAQVASECGIRHITVIAGITAQNEAGLHAKYAVPRSMLEAQLRALAPGSIGAVRIGALFGAENVRAVAAFLKKHPGIPVVVDPVFDATLGGAFADEATFEALRTELFTLPVILTPNIPEAQRLTGRTVHSKDDLVAVAYAVRALGPQAVFLKGGHLAGDPVDVLVTPADTKLYRNARLEGSMRGTGCVVAAKMACELAKGRTLPASVDAARAYVRDKIAARIPFGALHVAF